MVMVMMIIIIIIISMFNDDDNKEPIIALSLSLSICELLRFVPLFLSALNCDHFPRTHCRTRDHYCALLDR